MSKPELPNGYAVKKALPLRPNYSSPVDEFPWLAWVRGDRLWTNVGMARTEAEAMQHAIDHRDKVLKLATGVVTP